MEVELDDGVGEGGEIGLEDELEDDDDVSGMVNGGGV